MEPRSNTSLCCKCNQTSALERKLQKRNQDVAGLHKRSGLIAASASAAFEHKVTERVTESDIPRKIMKQLSLAGEAVTEAEKEMESLTVEITGLKQRLEEVMEQTRVCY